MGKGNVPHGQSPSGQMGKGNLYHEHDFKHHAHDTHTQEPAAVGVEKKGGKNSLSKHDWDPIYAWAKYRQSIGGKIDPMAVALARKDDGLADADIDEWIASRPPQTTAPLASPPDIDLPGESPPELLEQFLNALIGRINDDSIKTWFKPIQAMSRGDTAVYFLVPNASFRGWITQSYDYAVEGALEAIGLAGYGFEFVLLQPERSDL
jgi:hypothetical protein